MQRGMTAGQGWGEGHEPLPVVQLEVHRVHLVFLRQLGHLPLALRGWSAPDHHLADRARRTSSAISERGHESRSLEQPPHVF